MVIEHSFVTTLDPQQTMQCASEFLGSHGFIAETRSGFSMGQNEWDRLEMRRGQKKLRKAKNIAELPQVAHVHWDRGRVNVGLSIEPSGAWGGNTVFQVGLTSNSSVTGNPKKMKLHGELMMAIANGLEGVLAHRQDLESASRAWDAVEHEIDMVARKRRRRSMITLAIVFALIVAAIAVPIVLVSLR